MSSGTSVPEAPFERVLMAGLGHGRQRYVARVISDDGCVKRFDVRGQTEKLARRTLEKFLTRHWSAYRVAELQVADDRRKVEDDGKAQPTKS